ncbi:MAG TPA: aminotransferase class I/II-fold pyridoxal phosphate-dependent enzyme [Alphaproteobacteria bacterium]|nr:aminotransferase class I/II-fold pyridoxal phosphate-dependent enzyme [Alphaproteobacteria bacterium]
MYNARLELLNDYPFQRLADLLAGITPRANHPPIAMHVGEPQHQPPAFVRDIIDRGNATWNRYPPLNGTPEFRAACAAWLTQRYRLKPGSLNPETQIAPVAGTREGLFQAALIAITPRDGGPRQIALMPNPFYQVYYGAAVMAGAECAFMPATKATGFLPDLDAIPPATLARTAIMYLCSPANPQGAVADLAYLQKALRLARQYGFLLVSDECYSELYYTDTPPPGALEAAAKLGGGFDNLIVFHTLSKRSSAPGLRSGFASGSPETIARFNRLRAFSCAATPTAVMDAAAALWSDEEHVVANRALYRAKYEIADRLLGGRFGYYRPGGGFYLWLDVVDGEAAAKRLWQEAGIKVLPGGYVTKPDAGGRNIGKSYIRVALVHDLETTEAALTRMASVLETVA